MSGPAGRVERQLAFLLELDRAKQVERRSYLADGSRRENDAEHMWHLALFVLVLAEHAAEPVDVSRVLEMVVLHDVVEIDAGDTFVYDDKARAAKAALEERAARRIFGLLPDDQAAHLRSVWEEFEDRATPESRLAAALDRLQPLLLNLASHGRTWREHGITRRDVLAVNQPVAATAPALWQAVTGLLDAAVERGELEP